MNLSILNDFSEFEHLLLDDLQQALNLTSKQVKSLLETKDELDCSLGSAAKRRGLCSEEFLQNRIATLLNLELVDSAQNCPDSIAVINFTQHNGLSADWCIENGVFITLDDELRVKCYLSEIDNTFVTSVVFHTIDTLKTSKSLSDENIDFYLLSPAMLANVVDDICRERAVSELFGESSLNAAALAEEAPVVNLVNSILEKAVQADASDIHIEAGKQFMSIRLRIDGSLSEYMKQPSARFAAISSRIKLISGLDIAERRLPQDGRFTTRQMGNEFDVRVSTAPDVNGESIVMRLLPKKRDELSLSKLGFEADHLDMIKRWGKLSNGIVLVTGPTGSGKSTTLYSLLSDIKTGTEKIVTVEDPVEFQLAGITQVQAKPEIGYTFAKALRTFLRQDPDVIMVGEIRDTETAEIAIQSSLTGHLVLSTLHTNDALSVFPRLTDMGVEPFLISATIQGVQAQRLVKKLCTYCSEPSEPPSFAFAEVEDFSLGYKLERPANWRKPVGCPKCQGRGYKGRVGIYELVEMNSELRKLVSTGASILDIRACAKASGFRSLFEDGMIKAFAGVTSVEEVLRVCNTEDSE